MCLERLDCFFCNVTSMVVRWHQLVSHVVALDDCFEVVGALTVEDVLLGLDFCRFEAIN